MFNAHKNSIVKLYFDRMNCLRETLSLHCPQNIKWNVPQSGYFSCLHVEGRLNYDRISRLSTEAKINNTTAETNEAL